jgi:hypothetical protein
MLRRLALLLALSLGAVPSPAWAIFHLIKVSEVYGGGGATPADAQYVELQAFSSGQNAVSSHSAIFYNAAGNEVGRVTFPAGVPNGANQMTLLFATNAAANAFGVLPDLFMPSPWIDRAGGKICWDALDCFAWGAYTGPAGSLGTAVGTPFAALPAGVAVQRRLDVCTSAPPTCSPAGLDNADDTGDSANDFRTGTPSPRNNAGQTAFADGDGVDLGDNCPFYPNPSQTDKDGDKRGDDCECGDQNGDGFNTVSDLVAISNAIFNPTQITPLCDANRDGLCNVNDILDVNTEIFSPTNTSTCARQPIPGPP